MFLVCVNRPGRAILATVCLVLTACGGDQSSPEQRVRVLIEKVQQSIEAGSVRQVEDFLHARYSDPRHASRGAAMRTLFGITQRHRGIHLFTLIKAVDLSVRQDSASAVVFVAMTGIPVESMEALISLKADLHRFHIGLVEEGDDWLILNSRWERVDPSAL